MKTMSEFIGKMLKNELFIKIISVVLSIGIWLYIVNVADPRTDKEFQNVPVNFIYEGSTPYNSGLMMMTTTKFYVNVRVFGSRTTLPNFTKDKVTAKLNFNAVAAAGKHYVPIEISLADEQVDYEILGEPNISIEFQKKSTKPLPLTFEKIGNFPAGYELDEQNISLPTVKVEGPKDIVDKLAKATVNYDVSELKTSVIEERDINLYTDDGEFADRTYLTLYNDKSIIEKVTLSLTVVYREPVEIEATAKNNFGGDESSYTVVEVNPSFIRVEGAEDVIGESFEDNAENAENTHKILKLDDIALETYQEATEIPLVLPDLPEGVKRVSAETDENIIKISFGDAKKKTFTLNAALLSECTFLNVPLNTVAKISNSSVKFTLRSLPDVLDNLDLSQVKLSIDLNSPKDPSGKYLLTISLPENTPGGFLTQSYVDVVFEDEPVGIPN